MSLKIKFDERATIYGFHINSNESDPSAAVTYLEDAVGMTPANMDFTNSVLDYGSWKNAFFMPRPCMLRYDGIVDYYLSESDYTKKSDGVTASDVANINYGGNAMMEWGRNGTKIWYKIIPDYNDNTSASIYISDEKVDEDYRAWSFINANNQMVDHFYTPIYNGTLDASGRLRSISGLTSASYCQSKTAVQEITAAELNNPSTNKMWYTEQWSDIFLMNMLLVLIGKSLNTQSVFGNGRINQASAITSCLDTGTMDDKGLFYGSNGNNDGVKVFGMENYWGNHWRRFAGMIMVDYVQKYKMTRGTADGSTATDYNTMGNNYLIGGTAPQISNYISKHEFDENGMYVNSTTGGSTATYYCDYFWRAIGTRYASRGGACYYDANCGAFYLGLDCTPSTADWAIGAAPSCKPIL